MGVHGQREIRWMSNVLGKLKSDDDYGGDNDDYDDDDDDAVQKL